MLCHGVVINPPDPQATNDSRQLYKDALKEVIEVPYIPAGIPIPPNVEPGTVDIYLPDRTSTPEPVAP